MHQEKEPSVDASFQAMLSNATPAYQMAVNSGNTERAKFLQTFIEDNFEDLWSGHREALLKLSLPALSVVLSSDRLNIQAEDTVWLVIQAWTTARHAERLQHLPLLIKKCLRIGRLPQLFMQNNILRSSVYLDLSDEAHEEVAQHVVQACGLLSGARSQEALIDGRGLLYHKELIYFRPRDARHLLIAAGGFMGNTIGVPYLEFTSQIEVYDGQLELWRPIHLRTPYAGYLLALHYLDGFLYLFGRSEETHDQTLHALDLTQAMPIWRERCKILQPRVKNASVLLDGYLYVLGGIRNERCRNERCCDRYNLALDRWEAIAPLHYGRIHASAAAFRGRIYIAGGFDLNDTLASVEVYNPQSNSWQLVAPMAVPRFAFSLVLFGDRLWAINGLQEACQQCESYDPETDTWRQEGSIPGRRYYPAAIAFNGQIILAGGEVGTQHDVRRLQSTLKYDSEFGWTQGVPLSQGRSFFSLLSVPNIYPILRP